LPKKVFIEVFWPLAEESGLQPDAFFRIAEDLIHSTGYVTGRSTEAAYWTALREKTGITGTDADLREQILSRFVVRPEMLSLADRLRASGRNASILSDQTDWLDEIDVRSSFSSHFDRVYNSYHLHKSKRDEGILRMSVPVWAYSLQRRSLSMIMRAILPGQHDVGC